MIYDNFKIVFTIEHIKHFNSFPREDQALGVDEDEQDHDEVPKDET